MKLKRKVEAQSGYRGVYRNGQSWTAMLWSGTRQIYVGSSRSAYMCARMYDHAAWSAFGDKAKLNFPPLLPPRKVAKKKANGKAKSPAHSSLMRAYICSQRGRKTAAQISAELGLSRSAVCGVWHRAEMN